MKKSVSFAVISLFLVQSFLAIADSDVSDEKCDAVAGLRRAMAGRYPEALAEAGDTNVITGPNGQKWKKDFVDFASLGGMSVTDYYTVCYEKLAPGKSCSNGDYLTALNSEAPNSRTLQDNIDALNLKLIASLGTSAEEAKIWNEEEPTKKLLRVWAGGEIPGKKNGLTQYIEPTPLIEAFRYADNRDFKKYSASCRPLLTKCSGALDKFEKTFQSCRASGKLSQVNPFEKKKTISGTAKLFQATDQVDGAKLAQMCKENYKKDWHTVSINGITSADTFQVQCCDGKRGAAVQNLSAEIKQAKSDFVDGYRECLKKAAQVDDACIKLKVDMQNSYDAKLDTKKLNRKKSDELDALIGKQQQQWLTLGCAKSFSHISVDGVTSDGRKYTDVKVSAKLRQEFIAQSLPECKKSFFGQNNYCELLYSPTNQIPGQYLGACFTEQGYLAGECSSKTTSDQPVKNVNSPVSNQSDSEDETDAGSVDKTK